MKVDVVKEFKEKIPEASLRFLVGSEKVKEALIETLSEVQDAESRREENESSRESAEAARRKLLDRFGGVATPSTNPGTPEVNTFYLASEAGTYTNMGGVVLNASGLYAIIWDGDKWTSTRIADNVTAEYVQKIEEDVEVIGNGVLSSEIRAVNVIVDVAANYVTSPLPNILPAGTVITSISYKGGNFYFYNSSNKLIKPVVSAAVVPYTLTEDAHYIGGGVAGTISYSYNKEVLVSIVRPKIEIYSSDSQVDILDKMLQAIEQGNTDVHFQSSTYILDSVYIHMRDVLGESVGFKSNHFGLPIGNGCKYYLHGSTIISKAPQEEYTNVRNIFDTMLTLGDIEMHDGILINEGGTYCIHDEHGQSRTPYIHKYYNIIAKYVLTGDDVAGPKPFGCGTGYNACLCFDTCAFLSESAKDTVFALHGPVGNTDTPVTLSMFVKNCFFEKYSIQINPSTINNSRDNSSIMYCGNQHKYAPDFSMLNRVIEYNNSTI